MTRELAQLRAKEIVEDLRKNGISPKCKICRAHLRAALSIIRGCGPTCYQRDRIQGRLFDV